MEDITMAYYSNFLGTVKFSTKPSDDFDVESFAEKIMNRFNEFTNSEYYDSDGIFYNEEDNEFDIYSDEDVPWYTHEEDMLTLSTEFPDITFYLEITGEEQGDWCIKAFKNGKFAVEQCKPPVRPEI